MPFTEVLRQAFQNLRANRLRAILTLLIISFGIMALVGILTAIDAIAYSLNDNFSGLGANSFAIERKSGASLRGVRQKTGKAISYREAEASRSSSVSRQGYRFLFRRATFLPSSTATKRPTPMSAS